MYFDYYYHSLEFSRPARTSRGVLHQKPSYIIVVYDEDEEMIAQGECSLIPDLSPDYVSDFERQLEKSIRKANKTGKIPNINTLIEYPALRFGWEQIKYQVEGKLYTSDYNLHKKPIPINGLIWMEDIEGMWLQVEEKIKQGFTTLKLKIGALDFGEELQLLKRIRDKFTENITIRVDANGGFSPSEVEDKLIALSKYNIHSIEQPIAIHQWDVMSKLCQKNINPIALDEELIGIKSKKEKKEILEAINPQYIILKPSLIGGFAEAEEWIKLAQKRNIGYWVTSALEGNIGLNNIALWTATLDVTIPQGLGTGGLFTNNFPAKSFIKEGGLYYTNMDK